ncbi:MAG TPA: M13 family metallopeptidase N-terminal domain-containing protein, partial [Pirellulales bacterium]
MPHRRIINLVVSVLALTSLPFIARADQSTAAKPLAAGFDRSNFDTTVKPGEDFFQYVNGNWVKENPIPAEYSRWGMFMKLRDDNLNAQRQILENLEKQTGKLDANSQKLRDFYKTAMDEDAIEKQGVNPLDDYFQKIAGITDAKQLITVLGQLERNG